MATKFFTVSVLSVALCSSSFAESKRDVELAGDVLVYMLPTAALAKTLYEEDYEGTLQFTESMVTTVAVTQVLKYSVDAERPNGEDNLSFPSGHTSAAFSSASFIQMRYGWEYGLPAYLTAAFVGWSRVYSDNHYTRDVIAGAAIGVLSSFIFTDAYERGISITPVAENGIYGVKVSSRFTTY